MKQKITSAINKFELNLGGKTVLTEAATGNYVVTPIIAALAGANVYAYTRNSKYGTVTEVKNQTLKLANELSISNNITIIDNLELAPLSEINIVTNTGFIRPINNSLIDKLNPNCVIPLMWEPWEFRPQEIDIDACIKKGIKIYGTNESDPRLKTMDYLGFIVLYWLLEKKISPFSGNILIVGTKNFTGPIYNTLSKLSYRVIAQNDYNESININEVNCIIVAEYKSDRMIIGGPGAYIQKNEVEDQLIIHISGNIDLTGYSNCVPNSPKPYPYMSFTTDFIDNRAVVDLHTAGLKVAEGMLAANKRNLLGMDYKEFMESNYPALAFNDKKYW